MRDLLRVRQLLDFSFSACDAMAKQMFIKPLKILVLATAFLALRAALSPAQHVTPGTGLIAYVEGKVYLNEQRVQLSPAPVHIYVNSVVRTEDGRAEILLAEGVSLFLGGSAAFKLIPSSPYNFSRFELLNGSAVVATGEWGQSLVKCENEVTLSELGIYRFDVIPIPGLSTGEKVCGFKVYEGAAAVQLPGFISVPTRGKFMSLSLGCGDRIPLQKFSIEETDSLDDWSRQPVRLRRTQ